MTTNNVQVSSSGRDYGTSFGEVMVSMRCSGGNWNKIVESKLEPLMLHPASHALHYGSSCFDGLKAYRQIDGIVRIFRLYDHAKRFEASANLLCLPIPSTHDVVKMIAKATLRNIDTIPDYPASLYVRPVLIGVDASIGAATVPSLDAEAFIIVSPVRDYYSSEHVEGAGLTLYIEDSIARTSTGFGAAKAGANYASALRHIVKAKSRYSADQVLFCPFGDVQETGVSNFFLIDNENIVTKPLDGSLLPGITRDSILRIGLDLGYSVTEQDIDLDFLYRWISAGGELALSGTATTMVGVAKVIKPGGETVEVRSGSVGYNTNKIHNALRRLQHGLDDDMYRWFSDPMKIVSEESDS